jgi:hypothetical protein
MLPAAETAAHSYWSRLLRLVVPFNVHVGSWNIIVEGGVVKLVSTVQYGPLVMGIESYLVARELGTSFPVISH